MYVLYVFKIMYCTSESAYVCIRMSLVSTELSFMIFFVTVSAPSTSAVLIVLMTFYTLAICTIKANKNLKMYMVFSYNYAHTTTLPAETNR